jgi:hypothetical protein
MACQDECFVKTPLDVRENDEHSFEFSLDISRLFSGLVEFGLTAHVFFQLDTRL